MIFKAWPSGVRPFVTSWAQNNAENVLYYAQRSARAEIHPCKGAFVVYLRYMSDMLDSHGAGYVL